MTVSLVAGLWVVLVFGSALEAQPDLAGTWELANDVSLGGWPAFGQAMRVEQSGLFVRVVFDAGPVLDMKITERRVDVVGGRRVPVTVMRGSPWPAVEAEGDPASDTLRLRFTGPSDAVESGATRTARAYPPPAKPDAPR